MTEKINLKEFKKQIYLYYSEDGLADLAIGLIIFGFGIFLLVDIPGLVGLLGVIPFMIWYLVKQSLVVPRVGSIKPYQELKKRFLGFFTSMGVIGLGVVVLLKMSPRSGEAFFDLHPLAFFGLLVGLAVSSLGVILKTSRFYYYGILIFAALAGSELLGGTITTFDPSMVSMVGAGGMIMIAGFIVLARFLKKYPVISVDG